MFCYKDTVNLCVYIYRENIIELYEDRKFVVNIYYHHALLFQDNFKKQQPAIDFLSIVNLCKTLYA